MFGWGGEICFLIFAKQKQKGEEMLCKYLRSSLKTCHRQVFSARRAGALSSNLSLNLQQLKQKHGKNLLTVFCLAGVERFELPDDGVRVRSLTAWRHPN